MADRRRMLLQGPIAPALFRLAIPIILGNALQSGYQLTDAFWVGRLGAPSVAAVAVSFPVNFLVIALGAGWPWRVRYSARNIWARAGRIW